MPDMIFTQMLHGGDYNPEQWLDRPDILNEDLKLMKKAHVNCVTLGVFSWAVLEPEEGVFHLNWLKQIIDSLYSEGIRTILATPSGALPHWLTAKYPEVMQVREDGQRNLPGRRHNFCYSSPVMRQKIRLMDQTLSRELGQHPGVILWHISNELGGNFGDGACHCEHCQRAFRQWLQDKYQTLDRLNKAWWTPFWSHIYTDWDQIHSPVPGGEPILHALNLDWKRFVTCQMTDYTLWEIESVRAYSDRPVTTNFMSFFKNLDYFKLADCLDIVSWDAYPFWHEQKDEVPVAVWAAANHALMRSVKHKPFMLMESTPSCINWRTYNPMKRPGMHMLSSLQAVAHGSNTVQYFQWRKGRGSYEKFHGAVLDHKNGGNTRVFRDVCQVGDRLERISDAVLATCNEPRAAVIFDWENWWAVEDVTGPRLDMDYVKTVLSHYRSLWELGIDADLIDMAAPLDRYDLVIAPLNYLYRAGYADRVRNFVERGGTFVTTYWSGVVDDTDLCFLDHHPLEDVLGINPEEIDAPGPDQHNEISYDGICYETGQLCEISHLTTASALAVYRKDYYKDMPAVTVNRFGEGKAYYLAAEMEQAFLNVFYQKITAEAGLTNPLGVSLPYGVTTSVRKGLAAGDASLIFVQNFNNAEVCVEGICPAVGSILTDLDTGENIADVLTLEPFQCRILRQSRNQ